MESFKFNKSKEKTEIVKNAKNGKTANQLRAIDLSEKEGVSAFKQILGPIYDFNAEQEKKIIILDKSGEPVFPPLYSKGLARDREFMSVSVWEEKIPRILDLGGVSGENMGLPDKLSWKKISLYTGEFSKIPYLMTRVFNEGDIGEDEKGSSDFLQLLGTCGLTVSSSLNGGLPGKFLREALDVRKQESISSSEHPNLLSISMMINRSDIFFASLNEVFLKYLSNMTHNIKYIPPEIKNLEDILKEYKSDETHSDIMREKAINLEVVSESPNLDKEVENQTNWFIGKIEHYQEVLSFYDKKMEYIKPIDTTA